MAKKEKEAPQTEDELINENEAVENKNSEEENETEKLQKELDAAKEAHMRTLAEYDNFKKRTMKEKESLYKDGIADSVEKLEI